MSARRHALRASLLIGLLVSLLLLWVSLRQVDLHDLGRTFASIQPLPVLLSAAAVAASMALRALRWRWIAGLPATQHRQVARATYLGLLVNQIVPGRLGELVRVVTLARLIGASIAGPLASAVLDRLVDIAVLIAYAGLLSLLLPLNSALATWIASLLAAGCAVMALLIWFVKRAHVWDRPVAWLTARWLQRWSLRPDRFLSQLRHELHAIMSDTSRFGPVALVALAILCCDYLIVATLFLALAIPLTPVAPLVVLFFLAAGSVLPSAPGYIGVYQAAAVFALALFSHSAEQGVALASIMQIITLAVAALMNGRGAWALVRRARAPLPQ
ncbi:MAG: flippase-like domain-containing protein [Sphingobacteriia bacterium]|nr:flippase-like domain-containing protein [Sphingobacteriia bacterium]NCC40986.1 flippase-like domain-containing protein [Gammaproteobacteria bacterium]